MLNPLAQIQVISKIIPHPNADSLEIAQVLGWQAIVKKDEYKAGDTIAFLFPDASLPDKPCFSLYNSKSNRIKTIKLRGIFSQGVVESLAKIGYNGPIVVGKDIHEELGVFKYEPAAPQDLSAAGVYGFGVPKTDEKNWRNLDEIPYGEIVDVTLKIDGQSWSCFCKFYDGKVEEGVGGRSFVYKPDSLNKYTQNNANYDVRNRLNYFCRQNSVNLCVRGEQYGSGVQKSAVNPHSKEPLSLAFFSTWLIDEMRYATKGDPYYIFDIAPKMGLPTVPILEKDVVLTPELIKKYERDFETIDSKYFEGVVVNHKKGSFKIINFSYDSRK